MEVPARPTLDYSDQAELPTDAQDTGYHTDEFRIFINDEEADEAIYIQAEDGIERWPRSDAGCA